MIGLLCKKDSYPHMFTHHHCCSLMVILTSSFHRLRPLLRDDLFAISVHVIKRDALLRSVVRSLAKLTTNIGNDTEITPIIYPDNEGRKLDFSADLISVDNQTKFGSSRQAANTVYDPSRVCVNSTGEPVQREREKEGVIVQ